MATRVSSPAFVGRRQELGRLDAALTRARDGQSAVVLLAGEAGVGKTRFVHEVEARARASGARVLEGGCVQVGADGLPFGPFIEALRELAHDLSTADLDELLGSGRAELSRLMPGLLTAGAESLGTGLPDSSAQGRLFEHVLLLFERLARHSPLIVVVEDVHWADRSTQELLGFLARNLRREPIVLLATYRSDELHRRHPLLPFLAEQERSGRSERIELSRFDRPELAAQLGAILGAAPPSDLVERILVRSEGNAFFAEELLAGGASKSRLPETLREVLLARLATLSEPAQDLLRVAAAGGTRVAPEVLAIVTGTGEPHLSPALSEAVARHFLVPLEGLTQERYAFRHALLQEAVYGELLPGERTRLHAAFARALMDDDQAGVDASRAAELAYHWQAAHDLPRAFDAWLAAGIAAEAIYAFAEARASFEHALELWDQVPNADSRAPIDRVDVLMRAALAAEGPEPIRSVAHIRTAIALVDHAADPTRAGLLYERLGQYNWTLLDVPASLAAHEEAVRLVPAEPPSAARAWVLAGLGHLLTVIDRHADSAAICEEALVVAQAAGALEVESRALIPLGLDRVVLGDVDEGIETTRRAFRTARSVGNIHEAANALTWLIWALYEACRYDESVAVGLEAEAFVMEHGVGTRWSHCLTMMADSLFALGRWDESAEAVRRAQRFELVALNEVMVEHRLMNLEALRGQFESANRRAEHMRLISGSVLVTSIAPIVAELALWQGEPRLARDAIGPAIQWFDATPEVWVRYLGSTCAVGIWAEADIAVIARARHSEADLQETTGTGRRLLARMQALFREVRAERPYYVPLASAFLSTCEGEFSRLEASPDPNVWAAAAAAWDALQMPYCRGYALMREGEASLVGRSDRRRALAVLDEASAIAARLGAEPLLRTIETLQALAKAPRQRRPAVGPNQPVVHGRHDLSPREREVLRLVAAGRSDGEIGDALFISKKTASVHVANIKGKLGAQSRVEIVTSAIGLGLVDAP